MEYSAPRVPRSFASPPFFVPFPVRRFLVKQSLRQRADQTAHVAAARLLPKLLMRGLLVIVLAESLEGIVETLMGNHRTIAETLLGFAVLTVVCLPILYFSSLNLLTEAVAKEVAGAANVQFESIAAQVHDGILIYDTEGKIVYCNAAVERIHAAPAGSLVGQNLLSLMPSDAHAVFREDLAAFRKTGAGLVIGKGSAEVEGLRRDGQRISLEISTAPLAGDQNLIVAVLRDISGRKRMDEEITRLAQIPLMNPSPVLECAPDGAILYANPGARKLLGAIPSAAAATDFVPRFCDLAQQCLLNGIPISDVEATVKDRTLLWVLQPSGDRARVLAYATDITGRKQAEQALQHNEKQVVDLLDSLPVGVLVVADDKTVFANAAAARLYGTPSARDLLGLGVVDLVIAKDVERIRQYHRRRVAGQPAPLHYEVTVRRADGGELAIEAIAKRFFYGGRPGSLMVLRDLTTQKRLQLYEQILPVCCVCGQIRDDSGAPHGDGAWGRLDHYVMRHSDTQLSHTFCPTCFDQYRKEQGLAAT